ncbi:MAG TPA: glycosyltransferase family A protein [Polyangia bacterium]|jgi:hypothetical protein|nr:glycosyltransferase family A protein [Polyangia bacterium]
MFTNGVATAAAICGPAAAASSWSSDPLVSVIVPTGDKPALLERALGSLVRQTLTDFEVVVVNDGGARIEALLQPFASTLSVAYLRRHDRPRDRMAARQSALALARGKYIAYLDDDDWFAPEHLQVLVDALRQGTHKVAYSDATWVLEEKTAAGCRTVRPLMARSQPFDHTRPKTADPIPLPSVMHERACLDGLATPNDDLGARLAVAYDFLHVAKVTATISCRADGAERDRVKTSALMLPWLSAPIAAAMAAAAVPAPAPERAPAESPPATGFESDRALVLRRLLAAAASPAVVRDAGELAVTLLKAIDVLCAAPPAITGSLEERVVAALQTAPLS